MEFIESKKVANLLKTYPQPAREKLKLLKALIRETASETEGIDKLVETTKWGEPSYVTKSGSTIRMDWKEKTPENVQLYFICSTELVNTFRVIFGEELQFEGNRSIVLNISEDIPVQPIKKCLSLALRYHKIKDLPLLGV